VSDRLVDSQGRRAGAWIPHADCEGCRVGFAPAK